MLTILIALLMVSFSSSKADPIAAPVANPVAKPANTPSPMSWMYHQPRLNLGFTRYAGLDCEMDTIIDKEDHLEDRGKCKFWDRPFRTFSYYHRRQNGDDELWRYHYCQIDIYSEPGCVGDVSTLEDAAAESAMSMCWGDVPFDARSLIYHRNEGPMLHIDGVNARDLEVQHSATLIRPLDPSER